MGLDGYTSEVGITWNIFTVVLLCPTIFKAQKIACHHKPELETSMKYCSCFSWMIASLYMIYKKSSFRFKNFPFFVPSLLVRTLYYVETIPVSFIEVLCHRIHEVSILGLQRNRPSSAKKGWHVEKKKLSSSKTMQDFMVRIFVLFFYSQKNTVTVTCINCEQVTPNGFRKGSFATMDRCSAAFSEQVSSELPTSWHNRTKKNIL